jgi:osmotically-inducible protein OsmY
MAKKRQAASQPKLRSPEAGREQVPGAGFDDGGFSDEPPLDARTEELSEGAGYGRDDGPDSQGESAGRGFGDDGQGTFGDEDYDVGYGPTGLAGPEARDDSEDGADTPDAIDWDETAGDAADAVANEERDVATGDLSGLGEVRKKTSWSDVRGDDRIREEIDEILADLGEDSVSASVVNGEVVLRGSVSSTEDREVVDERVQDVAGIRGIENEIFVRDDAEAEPARPRRGGTAQR